MDFHTHVDGSNYGIAHFVFKGHRKKFLNYDAFLLCGTVFILANSAWDKNSTRRLAITSEI